MTTAHAEKNPSAEAVRVGLGRLDEPPEAHPPRRRHELRLTRVGNLHFVGFEQPQPPIEIRAEGVPLGEPGAAPQPDRGHPRNREAGRDGLEHRVCAGKRFCGGRRIYSGAAGGGRRARGGALRRSRIGSHQ